VCEFAVEEIERKEKKKKNGEVIMQWGHMVVHGMAWHGLVPLIKAKKKTEIKRTRRTPLTTCILGTSKG